MNRLGALLTVFAALAVAGWFVWPTPFAYEEEIIGWVEPEEWGNRSLAVACGTWLSDYPDPDPAWGYLPIFNRRRISRFSGKHEREIWIARKEADRGQSCWIAETGLSLSAELVTVSGIGCDGTTIHRPLRLRVPAAVRRDVESGRFGNLQVADTTMSWLGAPDGGTTSDADGMSTLKPGMAVLGVELVLRGDTWVKIPDAFELADGDGYLLAHMKALDDLDAAETGDPRTLHGKPSLDMLFGTTKDPGRANEKETAGEPAATRIIRLVSAPSDYGSLRGSSQLYVVNLGNGWRLEAPPLPSVADLVPLQPESALAPEHAR